MFAEPDAAKRAELLQQMRTIEHERGGLIVWGWVSVLNAHSDRVEGLEMCIRDSTRSQQSAATGGQLQKRGTR